MGLHINVYLNVKVISHTLALFSILVVTLLELAAISNDTSTGVGETTLLVCVGFGQPDVNITWSRDGQVISNSSLVSIYEEDLALGDRQFKQSFLQLCGLEESDSGTYICTVNNGMSSINSSTELSVIGEVHLLRFILLWFWKPIAAQAIGKLHMVR